MRKSAVRQFLFLRKTYSTVIQNTSPIKFIDFTFNFAVKFLPLFARPCPSP